MKTCEICGWTFTKRRPNSCQKCYFKKRHIDTYKKKPKMIPEMKDHHREYFGKRFYKNHLGYWACTTRGTPWAHRWVWINHHGEVPKGMDVHHIDEDKSNNEIHNLMIVTRSDHLKIHWEDPNDKAKRREFLNLIRPLSYEKLRTSEGRRKRSNSVKEIWKKRPEIEYVCKGCNLIKYSKMKREFCSCACRSRWKRQNKPNPIESICPICNKLFEKDKSDKKRCCSRSCGAKSG